MMQHKSLTMTTFKPSLDRQFTHSADVVLWADEDAMLRLTKIGGGWRVWRHESAAHGRAWRGTTYSVEGEPLADFDERASNDEWTRFYSDCYAALCAALPRAARRDPVPA